MSELSADVAPVTSGATRTVPAAPGFAALLSPLRIRDFRLLWLGEGVSLLGDQFHFVALSWLVLQLTGSGLALGTVLMAAAIPRAVLMVVGGAVTDLVSPRTVMVVSNAGRAALVAAIALLVSAQAVQVWHLVLLGLAFGVVDAFFWPALTALVPMLVPADRLQSANALHQAASQLMGLVGPAAAGVVIAWIGTAPAFGFDAGTFVVAVAAGLAIQGGRRTRRTAATRPAEPRAGVLETIRAGAAYTFRHPGLRAVLTVSMVLNFALNGPVAVGLPWLATHRYAGGSATLGFLFAAWGGGALLGALVAGTRPLPERIGLVVALMTGATGVLFAAVGLAPGVAPALILMAVLGVAIGWLNVVAITWMQSAAEQAMLGRVTSLVMLGSVGLTPVSYALAGAVVDAWATAMFVAAGLIVVGVTATLYLAGPLRTIERTP